MSKSKEKERNCHFCDREANKEFEYDIHRNGKNHVPVCGVHFDHLCDLTYNDKSQSYLSVGQKEYISIKRLESQLDVINTIQFK